MVGDDVPGVTGVDVAAYVGALRSVAVCVDTDVVIAVGAACLGCRILDSRI